MTIGRTPEKQSDKSTKPPGVEEKTMTRSNLWTAIDRRPSEQHCRALSGHPKDAAGSGNAKRKRRPQVGGGLTCRKRLRTVTIRTSKNDGHGAGNSLLNGVLDGLLNGSGIGKRSKTSGHGPKMLIMPNHVQRVRRINLVMATAFHRTRSSGPDEIKHRIGSKIGSPRFVKG